MGMATVWFSDLQTTLQKACALTEAPAPLFLWSVRGLKEISLAAEIQLPFTSLIISLVNVNFGLNLRGPKKSLLPIFLCTWLFGRRD
jgi:hypothetical protein